MRQFVIDELSKEERDNLESYLKRTLTPGPIEGLFWLPIPPDLLAVEQQGHDECGPFYFGVELEDELLRFELLVRSRSNLHCSCISFATRAQRDFVFSIVDTMLSEEMISA